VTECHNGATRDEQVRWFVETWRNALQLREEGVDLRAVTAWSLLGSFDWNRMVTRFVGHYEPGVFDVRGGTPRPTLMVPVLRDLAPAASPARRCSGVPGLVAPAQPLHRRHAATAAASSAARTIPASSPCCWWSATTAR
jgi:dTDP-4-dehydrorhamnose reductase